MEDTLKLDEQIKDDEPTNDEEFKELDSKELTRRLVMLEKQLSDKDSLLKESMEHNRHLMSKIEKLLNSNNSVEDPTLQIDSKIKELKEQRKELLKKFEFEKAEDIADEIEELKEQKKSVRQRGNVDSELVDAVNKFRSVYTWYDEDPVMQAAMNSVDDMLVRSGKWNNKPIFERLKAGAEIVEKRFGMSTNNQDNGTNQSIKTYNSVEGREMFTKTKNISLTDAQKRVADSLGISHKEYAEQLKFLERS